MIVGDFWTTGLREENLGEGEEDNLGHEYATERF